MDLSVKNVQINFKFHKMEDNVVYQKHCLVQIKLMVNVKNLVIVVIIWKMMNVKKMNVLNKVMDNVYVRMMKS